MWYGRPHWDRSVYLNCPNHQAHCTHTRSDFEKHYARDIEAIELQQRARMARERDAAREAASAREAQERRQQEEARREKEHRAEESRKIEAVEANRRQEELRQKQSALGQRHAELDAARNEYKKLQEEHEQKTKEVAVLKDKVQVAREALFKESAALDQLREEKATLTREIETLNDGLRALGLRGGADPGSLSMAFSDLLLGIDSGIKAVEKEGDPGSAFLRICSEAPAKIEERKNHLAEKVRIERQLEPLRHQKDNLDGRIKFQQTLCDRLRAEHSELDSVAYAKREAQTLFYTQQLAPSTDRVKNLESQVACLSFECYRS